MCLHRVPNLLKRNVFVVLYRNHSTLGHAQEGNIKRIPACSSVHAVPLKVCSASHYGPFPQSWILCKSCLRACCGITLLWKLKLLVVASSALQPSDSEADAAMGPLPKDPLNVGACTCLLDTSWKLRYNIMPV